MQENVENIDAEAQQFNVESAVWEEEIGEAEEKYVEVFRVETE